MGETRRNSAVKQSHADEETIFTVDEVAHQIYDSKRKKRLQSNPTPSIFLLEKAVIFNDKKKLEDETARDNDEERKR